MIYYFMVFIKLKYQTKPVATQGAHILFAIILNTRLLVDIINILPRRYETLKQRKNSETQAQDLRCPTYFKLGFV